MRDREQLPRQLPTPIGEKAFIGDCTQALFLSHQVEEALIKMGMESGGLARVR